MELEPGFVLGAPCWNAPTLPTPSSASLLRAWTNCRPARAWNVLVAPPGAAVPATPDPPARPACLRRRACQARRRRLRRHRAGLRRTGAPGYQPRASRPPGSAPLAAGRRPNISSNIPAPVSPRALALRWRRWPIRTPRARHRGRARHEPPSARQLQRAIAGYCRGTEQAWNSGLVGDVTSGRLLRAQAHGRSRRSGSPQPARAAELLRRARGAARGRG